MRNRKIRIATALPIFDGPLAATFRAFIGRRRGVLNGGDSGHSRGQYGRAARGHHSIFFGIDLATIDIQKLNFCICFHAAQFASFGQRHPHEVDLVTTA